MNIILVYNPQSGSAPTKQLLRRHCAAVGIEVEAFITISGTIKQKLRPYIANGRHIAVIGGDGTISTIAGLVAGTKATLIPLPGGTLNHFTKDLGIPQDVSQALTRLKRCKPRRVDIASVGDIYFINNSSLGVYPLSLRTREEYESRIGKWPAAVAASWRALVRLKVYRVTMDGESFQTPFIFIGNNRYSLAKFGGTKRAQLNQGVLTVYAAKTKSRLTLLKIALFALIGRVKQLNEFDQYYPSELTIHTKRSHLSVSHDGELSRLSSPLIYKIHPKALRILG